MGSGLALLLAVAPLAFGSIHEVSYTALEVGVFALGAFWLLWRLASSVGADGGGAASVPAGVPWWREPRAYVWGFLVVVALQTVPLPPAAVRLVSKQREALDARYRQASLEGPGTAARLADGDVGGITLSVSPSVTRADLYKCVAYGVGFFLVTGCLRGAVATRRLVFAIVAVGIGLAWLGLYQHFYWPERKIYGFWESRYGVMPFGPYPNRNHFAYYMAVAAPIALAQFLAGLSPRREDEWLGGPIPSGWTLPQPLQPLVPWGCLAAAVVMALAAFTSRSRGGVLAFLVGTSAVAVLSWRGRNSRSRTALLGVVLLVLWGMGLKAGGAALLTRFDATEASVFTVGSRPNIWAHAVRIWRDFPVFGAGLGSFGLVFPHYKAANVKGALFLRAHCDYLQALCEVGVVGTVFIAGFVLTILWLGVRAARRCPMDPETWLLVGLLGGAAAFLAHSIVEFNMLIPANAFMTVLMLGLAWNTTQRLRRRYGPSGGGNGHLGRSTT